MIDPYTPRYPTPRKPVPEEAPPLEPPTPSRWCVAGRPTCRLAGEHILREPRWAWPGRIPVGKLTLISGEPGVGKSMLAADLAARWTAALPWPDGKPAGEPGSVIFLCAEDSLQDTVLPRVKAGGGDPNKCLSLYYSVDDAGKIHPFSFPRDSDELGGLIEYAAEPRLMVIDPLAAYLGTGGDWGGEVQMRLAGLTGMAAAFNVTILAITHRDLRASAPGRRRSGAALGLLAGARAALQVVPDADDANVRHVVAVKNNLGRLAAPLRFRVSDSGHCAWEETASPAATDSDTPREPSERELAGKWLIETLADGPVAANELFERAQAALFSRMTLRRTARDLGIVARCDGFQGKWIWSLPAAPPKT